MFLLKSGSNRDCDGVTRRDVLRVGSLSAFGLGLPEFLRARAMAGSPGKDVSCILLWLQGGISHIDSFDPKPEAPAEIRGEFGVIDTNVAGIQVCDPLPRLAQHQDKFSILRSLNPRNGSHGVADAYMMTGHPFNQSVTFPAFGAVVAKEKGDRNSMPPYVQLGVSIDQRFGGGVAGFLGDQYNPFVLPGDASSPSFTVRDVTLPGGVNPERFQRRMKVLETVDTWQAQFESSSSALEAADTFYEKAYNLVTAPQAKKAFDIGREDPRIRDRYGRHSLGQGCLLARRLIESGVRFVTVTDGGWDTHQNNFSSLRDRLLPRLDSALSGLLQDLSDRGMLESTLVLTLSDFGRTPKVNPSAGRDHWSTAGIALLAGGGIRTGVAVGRTNALGEQPTEAPYYTEDLAATLYRSLGIPLDTTHITPDGRPIQINYDGRPIRELV
ncbi:DUF1501 domain-containing protein [Singulisphaera acidiphila]|uniref:Arylsulfatase A family protein n=1 Tax=Singulisphaera acidiphila (strain ATCC BAA-1392 / DSM 18658 / VKM B-2454 / MOB10) TaxID=886293 RepID=L0DDW9_SINAD|nr:DUF1501 domain-containing protein [Singulisphaera acidiphila]AGA27574.1 hypothetical protein Sinac_3304 [Singulisphaera acidiphila DSM 18658]